MVVHVNDTNLSRHTPDARNSGQVAEDRMGGEEAVQRVWIEDAEGALFSRGLGPIQQVAGNREDVGKDAVGGAFFLWVAEAHGGNEKGIPGNDTGPLRGDATWNEAEEVLWEFLRRMTEEMEVHETHVNVGMDLLCRRMQIPIPTDDDILEEEDPAFSGHVRIWLHRVLEGAVSSREGVHHESKPRAPIQRPQKQRPRLRDELELAPNSAREDRDALFHKRSCPRECKNLDLPTKTTPATKHEPDARDEEASEVHRDDVCNSARHNLSAGEGTVPSTDGRNDSVAGVPPRGTREGHRMMDLPYCRLHLPVRRLLL
mmetsp:Transcript_8015/g.16647  ORF Transcript_8015/g.16647 Transcript_8015/m.16647 type:complete len:315 (-) Transcript_8015:504-1448(-)